MRPGYGTLLNENRQKMNVEKRRRLRKKKNVNTNLVSNRLVSMSIEQRDRAKIRVRARVAMLVAKRYFETIKTIRINERREVMSIFTLILNHFGVAMSQ